MGIGMQSEPKAGSRMRLSLDLAEYGGAAVACLGLVSVYLETLKPLNIKRARENFRGRMDMNELDKQMQRAIDSDDLRDERKLPADLKDKPWAWDMYWKLKAKSEEGLSRG